MSLLTNSVVDPVDPYHFDTDPVPGKNNKEDPDPAKKN